MNSKVKQKFVNSDVSIVFLHYDISAIYTPNGNTHRLSALLHFLQNFTGDIHVYYPASSSTSIENSDYWAESFSTSLLRIKFIPVPPLWDRFERFFSQFLSIITLNRVLYYYRPSFSLAIFLLLLKSRLVGLRVIFAFQWLFSAPTFLELLIARLALFSSKSSILFDFCDCTSYYYRVNQFDSVFRNLYARFTSIWCLLLEFFALLCSDLLLCINSLEQSRFPSFFPLDYSCKITILPNRFKPSPAIHPQAISQLLLDNGTSFTVGVVGNWSWEPNLSTLTSFLKFLSLNPSFRGVVAGKLSPSLAQYVESFSDISDRLLLMGYVDDISDFYNAVDITFVWPRFVFGVQNKVIESLAYGRPVLARSNMKLSFDDISNGIYFYDELPVLVISD